MDNAGRTERLDSGRPRRRGSFDAFVVGRARIVGGISCGSGGGSGGKNGVTDAGVYLATKTVRPSVRAADTAGGLRGNWPSAVRD